jgi:anti-sigma B factor antagonist
MDIVIESFRDVAIVTLSGAQLDAVNAKEFKKGVKELIQTHTKIIFDLSAVRFIDSYGMGAMLAILMKLNVQGGDLKLCGVNSTVRMLFEQAYLHRLFEIFKNRKEAMRADRWQCDWKSIDIALTPDGAIRRRARAFSKEKSAA